MKNSNLARLTRMIKKELQSARQRPSAYKAGVKNLYCALPL